MTQCGAMLPRIDFRSGKPAHQQIVEQIKTAAARGTLRPGEALPSVGALSGELRINRNAVVKAYAELEALGLIERKSGGEYCIRESRRESAPAPRRVAPSFPVDDRIARDAAVLKTSLQFALLAMSLAALFAGFGVVVAAVALVPLYFAADQASRRIVYAKRFELPRLLRALKVEAPAQPDLESFIVLAAERSRSLLGAPVELIADRTQVQSLVRAFPALAAAPAAVESGADLLAGVFSNHEVRLLLKLPPKSSGQPYDAEDLDFLAELAGQAGVVADQFQMRHERQESEYAREIQQGLLPREIPQVAGFTIAGAWQPARNVGGDYYDVFALSPTQLALVIADVSGKGVPAALLMANLQATVKAYASMDARPVTLCANVNRAICRGITPGKFITFFYAVLDAESRNLTYANAGHNPPLLLRAAGERVDLDPTGPVLGIFPQAVYEESSVTLGCADRLLLYTDGIAEAADADGVEFGEERLLAAIAEASGESAEELRDVLMQRVTQFCRGDFFDDATLLAVVAGNGV